MMRRATKSNLLMKALSSRLGTMAITSSARLMVAGSVLGRRKCPRRLCSTAGLKDRHGAGLSGRLQVEVLPDPDDF